jgi:hypothetical protein
VRKSLGVALVAAVVAAAVTAIVALWLPAVNASKDRTWLAAGQRALAQVTLPASYRPYDNATAKIKVCSNGPDLRCFVGAGRGAGCNGAVGERARQGGVSPGAITGQPADLRHPSASHRQPDRGRPVCASDSARAPHVPPGLSGNVRRTARRSTVSLWLAAAR